MKRLSISLATALMAVAMIFPTGAFASPKRAFRGEIVENPGMSESAKKEAQTVKEFLAARKPGGQSLERVGGGTFLGDPAAEQTALLNVKQTPKKVLHRSADDPTGDIYAVFATFTSATSGQEGAYGKLNLATGGWDMVYRGPQFQMSQSEYYYQTGAVRENILHIPAYYENPATGEYRITWTRVDLETGDVLDPLNFGSTLNAFFYSMVYDEKNDCFWGLSVDINGQTGGNLIRVDCAGNAKYWYPYNTGINVGPVEGEFANEIVYNPIDQLIYVLRDNGQFLCIDPTTQDRPVPVFQFDEAEAPFCFNEMYITSPLIYSPRDKAFIGMHANSAEEVFQIYAIDVETYDVYEISTLHPTGYVASLYCTDKYAVDNAPDRVENLKVNLVENQLSGSFEFTMPVTTFGGIALPASQQIDVTVAVDGKTAWTGKALPGATVKQNYTFTQGLHNLSVTPKLSGDLVGPEIKLRFYAGNDNPFPPQDVDVSNYVITWGAPREGGVHNGYVDNNAVTYNVYWDGTRKLNSEPLTECKFTIPEIAQMERHVVTVKTLVNGMESEPSTELSRIFGPAFQIPVNFTPTAAEANLFEIIDANRDATGTFNKFRYNASENCFEIRDEWHYTQANDFLFFPRMAFNDGEAQYSVSFNYCGYFADPSLLNTYDLYLATSVNTNTSRMTRIDSRKNISVPSTKTHIIRFVVPEPGEYYIVLHEKADDQKYRGAKISDFKVQKLEGYTTEAPAEATDVSIASDPTGKMEGIITFTAPTLDLKNRPLVSSEMVTITAKNSLGSVSTQVLPGAKGELRIPTDIEGKQEVYITSSNTHGEGVAHTYYTYIGLDVPTAPRNVKGKSLDNNLGLTLSWDVPSAIGENNGYVDVNDLTYRIMSKSGINYVPVAEVYNDFSYTFRVNPGDMAAYFIGPMAVNSKGQNRTSEFIDDVLGTPYELPMSEEFSNTKFQTKPWTQSTHSESLNVYWETATDLTPLGVGTPNPRGGGMLYAYNAAESSGYGSMYSPKFSTKGQKKASINLRYWSCAKSTSMELFVRSNKDQQFKKVEEINGRQVLGSSWKDWKVVLPDEYMDCDWVQTCLRGYHRTGDTYTIIDSYAAIAEVEYEFAVTEVSGPYSAIIGESPEFEITVVNGGLEAARPDLLVELVGYEDGNENVLDKKNYTLGRINASSSLIQKVNFDLTTDAMKYSDLRVRATVSYPDDEIVHNNVKSTTFIVKQSMLPVVTDLKGQWNANNDGASLSWSAPATEWGPHDDFEVLKPFQLTDRIGQWKNVDMDGKDPFYLSGCEWENCTKPSGWMVINAEEAGLNDERTVAKSGKQYIMARSIGYDGAAGEDPIPAIDWLISPRVVGGSDVNFWMGTIDTNYTETITLFYSSTTDQLGEELEYDEATKTYYCGAFKSLRHFTKSGSDAWEEINFRLPEDARYFAFVYRSIGMLGCMIDDIQFSPVNNQSWDIESYDIIRSMDGNESIIDNVKDTNYVDLTNKDMNAVYYVTPIVYNDGKAFVAPKSNPVTLTSSAVDEIFGENTFVGGGKNIILFGGLAGNNAKVFAADGKMVRNLNLNSDREVVNIESGVYVVTIGKKSLKVFVK